MRRLKIWALRTEDIREHIRDNVQSADFSVQMISKNYMESEICLVWISRRLAGSVM